MERYAARQTALDAPAYMLIPKSQRACSVQTGGKSRFKRAVRDEKTTTIALLGGNTIVGRALSLLLREAGYDVRILSAPPTRSPEELMDGVDLLLISPGLTGERCKALLAPLRGTRDRMNMPILKLSSVIREDLLKDEVGVVPWPMNIDGLIREIEGSLEVVT